MDLKHSFLKVAGTYFRKEGHLCDINKKGHFLLYSRQYEDEPLLSSMQFKVFGMWKCQRKLKKGIVYGYYM